MFSPDKLNVNISNLSSAQKKEFLSSLDNIKDLSSILSGNLALMLSGNLVLRFYTIINIIHDPLFMAAFICIFTENCV